MLFEGVVDGDHAPLPCSFTAACRLTPAHPRRPPTHDAGRPPFRARNREEAERFFVDSLDAWRREQGLDKMVLMGELRSVSACLHGSTALPALMRTIEQASAWLWVHGCRKRAGGWQRRLLLPGRELLATDCPHGTASAGCPPLLVSTFSQYCPPSSLLQATPWGATCRPATRCTIPSAYSTSSSWWGGWLACEGSVVVGRPGGEAGCMHVARVARVAHGEACQWNHSCWAASG